MLRLFQQALVGCPGHGELQLKGEVWHSKPVDSIDFSPIGSSACMEDVGISAFRLVPRSIILPRSFGLSVLFEPTPLERHDQTFMTLSRFVILFVIGLVAAIAFKITWLYWLLAVALAVVLLLPRFNG